MSKKTALTGSVAWVIWLSAAYAGPAPRVVKTVPANKDADVNPSLDQIVVTFDIPIKQNSHSLVVIADTELPELVGDEPVTFPDNTTCAIKVKLKPNTVYGLGINSKTRTGFKSAEDGTPAVPFELLFKTTTAEKAGAVRVPVKPEGPHVVKTDPPNGAKNIEAGTYDLTLVFSEPMRKDQASIITPKDGPRLKPVGKPRWEDARTFVATVMLERGQNYRLGINVIEPKRFVTAGDGTPAEPYELLFSTVGAPAAGLEKGKAGPGPGPGDAPTKSGPVSLRYDYRKGDAGRVIRKSILDVKLNLSNGQTVPIGHKMGLNCIEEVLTVEKGQPAEVLKMISEYIMIQTDPQTGQTQAAPKLEGSVKVKVDRRAEPANVETVEGQVPKELMDLLAQDSFNDLLPTQPIKVGQTYDLPAETVEEIKKAFDQSGSGQCNIKLIARRIGPRDVEDARNEMFKAKGGGEPVTYVFNVAEFDIDWKQDGIMQGGAPFALEATGKIVFAIDAGVLLGSDIDAKITIKPVQTQDQNGQPITIKGGGTYTIRNSFEPINWTHGAKRKGGETAAKDEDKEATPKADVKPEAPQVAPQPEASEDKAEPAKPKASAEADLAPSKPVAKKKELGEPEPAEDPLSTPKGSIVYQYEQVKAGNVEALKKCFTDRVRDRITAEAVKEGQETVKEYKVEDLVGEVIEGESQGAKTAKIKMKNGRTLTVLVLTEGQWLSERVWFK